MEPSSPLPRPVEPLILASGSRYRAQLLARLQLPFESLAPDLDETPQPGETAAALTRRLARAKAQALAARYPQRWVLGSDQSASLDGATLGKPGTQELAVEQLLALSGRSVEFHTAVAFAHSASGALYEDHDVTTVRLRTLSRAQVERYLAAEPAYDCAGSFKCEGYGIALFESIRSDDPSALIGLPLIAVRRLVERAGFVVL